MKSRDIQGFRKEMRQSIQAFYQRRGLSGGNLYAFSQKLQNITNKLRSGGKTKDEVKKALLQEQADLLKFPHLFSLDPIDDGSFIVLKQGELTETEASLSLEKRSKIINELLTSAYKAIINGVVASEGHYAGLGTRLESPKPKFTMTAKDLLQGLKNFAERISDPKYESDETYQKLDKQIKEYGGLDTIIARFQSLHEWTIGERIFLSKLYAIYQLAKERFGMTDEGFKQVIQTLKFKIIINEESGEKIIENFIKNKFFGLNPRNIIFMKQAQHPTLEVSEDGTLKPDETHLSQGNHGLIPLQANLEDQWFRIIPTHPPKGYREEKITTTDYKDFQNTITILVVESVEDTMQYIQPYDYSYLAYVEKLGKEMGIQMFMKIVGQKEENPQKGGFLAAVTLKGNIQVNQVIESNRAPEVKNAEIKNLNLNRNAFYKPNEVDDAIMESEMIDDLHPTFLPEGKDFAVRIVPQIPQGDRNLYLKTVYIKDDPPRPISNLKDPLDILPTLDLMRRMEDDPELMRFAEGLGLIPSTKGPIFIFSHPLPWLAPIAAREEAPLSFEHFKSEEFITTLSSRSQDHLRAIFEICEVVGSLVREFKIDSEGRIFLKTLPETMKGKGKNYPSRALDKEQLASDSKALIAQKPESIYVGKRYNYLVVDISNKQLEQEGEIITLILKIKDKVAAEDILRLFAGKLKRIQQSIADRDMVVTKETAEEKFLEIPLEDILTNSASKLAEIIIEKLTKDSKS